MARGVNKVILVGNLGADPEVKYTAGGTAICTLSVATSESWKDKQSGEQQERTEWHRVKLFGRLAEIAGARGNLREALRSRAEVLVVKRKVDRLADHADVPPGLLLVEVLLVKHLTRALGLELPEPPPLADPGPSTGFPTLPILPG